MIVGFRAWSISKDRFAACLSLVLIPVLSFMLPSSFRTSWGTSHSIGSEIIWLAISSKWIFSFVVVMTKFVSSKIFIGL